MTERRPYRESKRGIDLVMTKEDDVAFAERLRKKFSPLEILAVDFGKKELRIIDSLADAPDVFTVFITNPDPGELSLERLQTALLFCDEIRTDVFRNCLPRRQALRRREYGIIRATRELAGRDLPIELMDFGQFHITYDRNDAEAHRFANAVLRLLHRMLVNRYAVVDAETDQFVRETQWPLWAGPSALESCRRHPHRYILGAWCKDDEHHFLAPLPPERYEELKSQRRQTKR